MKNTKKALLTSLLSIVLCLSMLIGSTFAWFTDTATTGVNKIVSGNLDIEMYTNEACTEKADTLTFKKAEGAENEEVLFEPGAKYELTQVWLKNDGNLHAKYQVFINGIDAATDKLAEVLDVYIADEKIGTLKELISKSAIIKEHHIAPGETQTFGTIALMMQTTAGNDYQGLTIDGISITVIATQYTAESDSYGNRYDENADWPILFTTAADLANALQAGKESKIVLTEDITIDELIKVAGDKVIDLNGKTLTVTEDRGITVADKASLTLTNGTIEYAGTDAPIIVSNESELIIDGATINVTNTITGGTYGNAAGIIVNNGYGSVVTMNSGEINVKGANGGSGIYVAYNAAEGQDKRGNHIVNFNGGTINVETGKYGVGIECLSTNTLNLNGGVINMKDASEGWAFNVGQSQDKPTVVTGNGKTVVNLYGDANISYESGDAAEFEGVNFVENKIVATVSDTTELADALTNATSGDTIAVNNAVELNANLPAGVSIAGNGPENTSVTVPANTTSDSLVTGLQIKDEGTTISGVTLTANETLTSDQYAGVAAVKVGDTTFDNVVINATGNTSAMVIDSFQSGTVTISNSTLTSRFKTIHMADGANGKVVIENTDITGVYTFNVNSASSSNLVIEVTNSKLHGWTSYGPSMKSASFTNTEFSKGDSAYDYLRAYAPTTFTDCTFDEGFKLHGMKETTIELVNCSWNGVLLTAENIKNMLDVDDDLKACTITVDGVTVTW